MEDACETATLDLFKDDNGALAGLFVPEGVPDTSLRHGLSLWDMSGVNMNWLRFDRWWGAVFGWIYLRPSPVFWIPSCSNALLSDIVVGAVLSDVTDRPTASSRGTDFVTVEGEGPTVFVMSS